MRPGPRSWRPRSKLRVAWNRARDFGAPAANPNAYALIEAGRAAYRGVIFSILGSDPAKRWAPGEIVKAAYVLNSGIRLNLKAVESELALMHLYERGHGADRKYGVSATEWGTTHFREVAAAIARGPKKDHR